MANYLPWWMVQPTAQNMLNPTSPYWQASQISNSQLANGAMQPNMFAPQSNPYDQGAAPLSGGVSGLSSLLQNASLLQGIAALGQSGSKAQQPMMAPAPMAPTFNGAMFTPRF